MHWCPAPQQRRRTHQQCNPTHQITPVFRVHSAASRRYPTSLGQRASKKGFLVNPTSLALGTNSSGSGPGVISAWGGTGQAQVNQLLKSLEQQWTALLQGAEWWPAACSGHCKTLAHSNEPKLQAAHPNLSQPIRRSQFRVRRIVLRARFECIR